MSRKKIIYIDVIQEQITTAKPNELFTHKMPKNGNINLLVQHKYDQDIKHRLQSKPMARGEDEVVNTPSDFVEVLALQPIDLPFLYKLKGVSKGIIRRKRKCLQPEHHPNQARFKSNTKTPHYFGSREDEAEGTLSPTLVSRLCIKPGRFPYNTGCRFLQKPNLLALQYKSLGPIGPGPA